MRLIVESRDCAIENLELNYHLFDGGFDFVRLFWWSAPAITLGRAQNSDNLNLRLLASHDIKVVKRKSGGGVAMHGHDLSFCVSGRLTSSPRSSLFFVRNVVLELLSSFGVKIDEVTNQHKNTQSYFCHEITNGFELSSGGKKIVGLSQMLLGGRFLIEGTIGVYEPIDFSPYFSEQKPNAKKLGYLNEFAKIGMNELVDASLFLFGSRFGAHRDSFEVAA